MNHRNSVIRHYKKNGCISILKAISYEFVSVKTGNNLDMFAMPHQ